MQNKDIHQNFNQSDLRDFLSKELRKAQRNCGGQSIQQMEKEIEELRTKIEATRNYEVLKSLIVSQRWEEFDVSDEISDHNFEKYFPFIGNEKDYEKLMAKIGQEE